jgi:serine/threonine-protein kinase PknG
MKCARAGCAGLIEDGFCNVCGLAPVAAPTAGPDSAPSLNPPTSGVGSQTSASGVSVRGSQGGSRASRPSGTSVSRGHLGAGLIEVPSVPYQDPTSVVMADPKVAESKRFCGHCGAAVGRRREERPGRTEGFCPQCGTAFSFSPKLRSGDLVAGQYQVAGCLAHGGLGWVYLAQDRNVSDRWVVLKGLLDTGDESAMAAAIAERRFLAQVEHPNIVRIYNFVQHEDAGYIVMEYVGGQSLRDLRRGSQPLPPAQAIAYMIEALPALGYLHGRGFLYCDFKPDNVIQTEEQLKIIDLGGVRRLDDDTSDLYGTVGYQAPEVAEQGPSIASDLYTVARTLAVLSFDFRGYQDPARFADGLPPAGQVPLFQRYPPLHRFLLKGTHPDPERRFASAAEMTDQLLGVLRQVLAIDGGDPQPAASRLFTPELGADPGYPGWKLLPIPAVDPSDPAAGMLASLAAASPDQVITALEAAVPSPDVDFQRARAMIELDDLPAAVRVIEARAAADAYDWRGWWWQGIVALARAEPGPAREMFDRVAADVPGELAPVLASGVAAELQGDGTGAAAAYGLVAATDPGFASATFGLARVCRQRGDRQGAATALRRIPSKSSAHAPAQAELCSALMESSAAGLPTIDDLIAAAEVLAGFDGDQIQDARLTRDLLVAALGFLGHESGSHESVRLAGVVLDETQVRTALEQTCRTLAKLAVSGQERVALVDEANAFRPRSLW